MIRIRQIAWTLGAALALSLALGGGGAVAQNAARPQYGGALEIGSVYVTLSALSWDPQDWNWKLNHDTGMFWYFMNNARIWIDREMKKKMGF